MKPAWWFARDEDDELDDFSYDNENVALESEIGEYRADDEEEEELRESALFPPVSPAEQLNPTSDADEESAALETQNVDEETREQLEAAATREEPLPRKPAGHEDLAVADLSGMNALPGEETPAAPAGTDEVEDDDDVIAEPIPPPRKVAPRKTASSKPTKKAAKKVAAKKIQTVKKTTAKAVKKAVSKAASKKAATKKPGVKKGTTKKTMATKKTATKKAVKAPAKKAVTKVPAKKAAAKKAVKKAPAKKAPAKKAVKKAPAKKAAAKKR